MKTFFAIAGGIVLFFALIISLWALGLGGRWLNLKVEAWFQPREANVQREVFENTKSFNEGKEQELLKVYQEYLTADDETKAGLRTYVSHTFADYNIDRLDVVLQNFVKECRGF